MSGYIVDFPLDNFSRSRLFPFHIEYGKQSKNVFAHTHHDFMELVIVLEGSAIHVVNNEEFVVSKGDVFVVGNDIAHSYKNAENFLICNIMYCQNNFFHNSGDISLLSGFQALFVLEPYESGKSSFCHRLKLTHKNFEKVRQLTNLMLDEYNRQNPGCRTLLKSYFLELAVILSRLYEFDESPQSEDIINLAKAAAYIETHFAESIDVAQLAQLSHYSERHFLRLFTQTYKATPTEYITNLRINHACILLKDKKCSVSEAAIHCGYTNVNYFSRVFRKKTGLSPTEYKKQI